MQQENEAMSTHQQLDILAAAISDIGYWSWWTENLPDIFQIEFGGTQLYFPPTRSDMAPQTKIAVRFDYPSSVSFISKNKDDDFEWSQLLQQDKMEPPSCKYGEFSFGNSDLSRSLQSQIVNFKTIHGMEPTAASFLLQPISLIFWCGNIGLAIAAEEIGLLNHAGDYTLSDISDLHRKWWEYWKIYWEKRGSSDPLPKDFVCEVTIPIKK